MQTLYFEPAWDKTIAAADREKIIIHFQSRQLYNNVHLAFLWEAINHKGEQLVTVLIHNNEEIPLTLQNTAISYTKNNKHIAKSIFNLPLTIPKQTSMPWTFIFSSANRTNTHPLYIIINGA